MPEATVVTVPFVTRDVTVYEDRAEVTRVARVTLPAGASAVVLRDLSPLVDESRVVARLEGDESLGHVDDIVVARVLRADGGDAIEARRRARAEERAALEAAYARLVSAVGAAEGHRAQVERLASAAAAAHRRRAGRGVFDVAATRAELDAARRALDDADARVALARAPVLESEQALRDHAAIATDAGAEVRRVTDVTVRLSLAGAGEVTLVVSTIVPCAAWRPTHEAALTHDAGQGTVTFTGHGAVWNRTGEPWTDARLTLSTARPSLGAQLPAVYADEVRLRTKTAEERKTIVVEHRTEEVPKSATQGGAPGVDDGGEVRTFVVERASVPDDGRPHRVQLFSFRAPAKVQSIAIPERAAQVFLRASFKNAGGAPILAGPVALSEHGAFVGTGDVLYCGPGDELDLAFGSDDGLSVTYTRSRAVDKKMIGKDITSFVQEATVTSTKATPATIELLLRLPVSELAQLKVVHSAAHSTIPEPKIDEHGLARVPITVNGGADAKVAVAFFFDTSGDVRLPDPW